MSLWCSHSSVAGMFHTGYPCSGLVWVSLQRFTVGTLNHVAKSIISGIPHNVSRLFTLAIPNGVPKSLTLDIPDAIPDVV